MIKPCDDIHCSLTQKPTCVWRRVKPSSQRIWPGRPFEFIGVTVIPPTSLLPKPLTSGMSYSPVTKMDVGCTSPRPNEKNLGRMFDGIVAMICKWWTMISVYNNKSNEWDYDTKTTLNQRAKTTNKLTCPQINSPTPNATQMPHWTAFNRVVENHWPPFRV